MGGINLEYVVDSTVMRKRIKEVRKRLLDHSDVMEDRAQKFLTMTKRDVFNEEESPLGEAWPSLASTTAKRKGSTKILTDIGTLQNAIVAEGTETSVRIGVSGDPATYAATHQFGHTFNRMSSRGKPYQIKIPRRPFLPLDESGDVVEGSGPMKTWMDRLRKRVLDYVLTGEL